MVSWCHAGAQAVGLHPRRSGLSCHAGPQASWPMALTGSGARATGVQAGMWCNAGAQAVGLHQQVLVLAKPERPVERFAGKDWDAPAGGRARQPDAHDAIRQSPEQAEGLRTSVARCRATHGCRPLSEKPPQSTNPLMPLATRPAGTSTGLRRGRAGARRYKDASSRAERLTSRRSRADPVGVDSS